MPRPRSAPLPPELLFVISGIAQYAGASIAVNIFDEVEPATVAWLRVAFAAIAVLAVSRGVRGGWTRADLWGAAAFGVATALMNLSFYLAIERVDLGKSVVIEFIGPIVVAAALTRTRRNTLALVVAVVGVLVLGGVEIDDEPAGLAFIGAASVMWALYIVLGRRVAMGDRGLAGLGMGLAIGAVAITPAGVPGAGDAFGSARLLALCAVVGVLSTAVGYGIDQVVMRRIPTRRFALLLALLPVTAMVVGFVALDQEPSALDLFGAALVIIGVLIQERDELVPETQATLAVEPS